MINPAHGNKTGCFRLTSSNDLLSRPPTSRMPCSSRNGSKRNNLTNFLLLLSLEQLYLHCHQILEKAWKFSVMIFLLGILSVESTLSSNFLPTVNLHTKLQPFLKLFCRRTLSTVARIFFNLGQSEILFSKFSRTSLTPLSFTTLTSTFSLQDNSLIDDRLILVSANVPQTSTEIQDHETNF